MPGVASPYKSWVDLNFTGTLSSIEYRSNTSTTYKPTLYSIEIDGRLLLDNGVTPTDNFPSISSSVRASTTSGLSVVTFTGTGSNETVAHGLSAEPYLLLTKCREAGFNWACLLYTSPSPRDQRGSRMPSSA